VVVLEIIDCYHMSNSLSRGGVSFGLKQEAETLNDHCRLSKIHMFLTIFGLFVTINKLFLFIKIDLFCPFPIHGRNLYLELLKHPVYVTYPLVNYRNIPNMFIQIQVIFLGESNEKM